MKTAWYIIKNVALAIGITIIGSYTAREVNSAILWIVGIYLIFAGFSNFGETNPWISLAIIGIGVGATALGKTVLKDNEIPYYISAVLIALIAFKQLAKVFNSYGSKKWQKLLMKILTLAYPLFIIAGSVFAVFFQDLTKAASLFSFGSLLWIIHTVLVVVFKGIPSRKKGSRSSSGSSSGGAGSSRVASEMSSLASYFTGGFDSLPYGSTVTYSVSSRVSGGEITFTVSGKISVGNVTTQSQAESVRNALSSAVSKRQQLILNKAGNTLESLNPDGDYSINVVVGNFS